MTNIRAMKGSGVWRAHGQKIAKPIGRRLIPLRTKKAVVKDKERGSFQWAIEKCHKEWQQRPLAPKEGGCKTKANRKLMKKSMFRVHPPTQNKISKTTIKLPRELSNICTQLAYYQQHHTPTSATWSPKPATQRALITIQPIRLDKHYPELGNKQSNEFEAVAGRGRERSV